MIEPKAGTRVVHMWRLMNFIRGTITRDCGSFARVKWDDEKFGETSEDYDVILPEDLMTPEIEADLK